MSPEIPADHLSLTKIYHITHVENLVGILTSKAVLAKNLMGSPAANSIANEEIQERRVRKQVEVSPYGNLHDYVPFYFAPRSPMLCCNHHGAIANAKPQGEIIHLVTTAQVIAANNLPFVFYDRHAVVGYAQPHNELAQLGQIDWRIFFEPPLLGGYAKYWQDRPDASHAHWFSRKEVRQAEFLVHRRVPVGCLTCIGVENEKTRSRVNEILNLHSVQCPVSLERNWYF